MILRLSNKTALNIKKWLDKPVGSFYQVDIPTKDQKIIHIQIPIPLKEEKSTK